MSDRLGLKNKLLSMSEQKSTYLIPENIKAGVKIFDVTGTYTGSGGVTGVKLFDTVEHMQQDAGAQEGDLAVVYGTQVHYTTNADTFQSVKFPSQVVLPQAHTSSTSVMLEALDTSKYIEDCSIYMSKLKFSLTVMYDDVYYYINYKSTDGITYNRIDSYTETVDLGTEFQFSSSSTFNNDISYFMTTETTNYSGLFEYRQDENKDKIAFLTIDSVKYTKNNDVFRFTGVVSNIDISVNIQDIKGIISGYNLHQIFYSNVTNKLYGVDGTQDKGVIIDLQGNVIGIGSWSTTETVFHIYEIDVNSKTISLYETVDRASADIWYRYSQYNTPKYTQYFVSQFKPTAYSVWGTLDYANNSLVACSQDDSYIVTGKGGIYYFSSDTDGVQLYPIETRYYAAITQITAVPNEVYNSIFYGANGVEQGTLQQATALTLPELRKKVTILNDIYNITLDPDLTSLYSVFSDNTNLYTLNLDVSNVTNMKEGFSRCTNLQFVSLKNSNKITDMNKMFYICSSLIAVGELNTSSVVNMANMFESCVKLQSIPQQLNTANVTNMQRMFCNCPILTTIPLLSTANVTNMNNMFASCNKLSMDTLNIILQMCINATNVSTKTLKYIGLSQAQATTCQSLSNWSAFTSAGWTTGY